MLRVCDHALRVIGITSDHRARWPAYVMSMHKGLGDAQHGTGLDVIGRLDCQAIGCQNVVG